MPVYVGNSTELRIFNNKVGRPSTNSSILSNNHLFGSLQIRADRLSQSQRKSLADARGYGLRNSPLPNKRRTLETVAEDVTGTALGVLSL
jgi:hypothetical protein